MFWNIDGTAVSLLGAVHVTNLRPLRVPDAVEKAFFEAASVVFETQIGAPVDGSPMLLPSGTKLDQIVPPAIHQEVVNHCDRLGVPLDQVDLLRPAMVAMWLQIMAALKNGYSLDLGVDRHFWDRATLDLKSREVLETHGDQMSALVAASTDEQISLLEYFVRQDDAGLSELSNMVANWARGDITYFEHMAAERRQRWPQAFSVLLDQRNANWIPRILEMVRQPVPRLIIVGALHMVGPTGLPTLLRRHGVAMTLQPW